LDLNIKDYSIITLEPLIKLIQKHELEDNIYIESRSAEFLTILKAKAPGCKLFIYPVSFESGLEQALSLGLFGITISTRDITIDQIKIADENTLMVALWNVHTESDHIEAINKNPDVIQTGNVKNLVKLIK